MKRIAFLLLTVLTPITLFGQSTKGYYRFPTIHQQTVVFISEGDLWKVGIDGGVAQRLTTHHGVESHPAISPDGRTVAFSAQYEGPTEVYTMPIAGGLPTRKTFEDMWRKLSNRFFLVFFLSTMNVTLFSICKLALDASFLACVASVSNRVIARKLERKQKKG